LEVEVPDHLLYEPALLGIFLTEYRDPGLNNIEQFCDNSEHPAKMTGARQPAEAMRNLRLFYKDSVIHVIHVFRNGTKQNVDALSNA